MVDYLISGIMKTTDTQEDLFIIDGTNMDLESLKILGVLKHLKKDEILIRPVAQLETNLLELSRELNGKEKLLTGTVEDFIFKYLDDTYSVDLSTEDVEANKELLASILKLSEKDQKDFKKLLEKLSVESIITNKIKKAYALNFIKENLKKNKPSTKR